MYQETGWKRERNCRGTSIAQSNPSRAAALIIYRLHRRRSTLTCGEIEGPILSWDRATQGINCGNDFKKLIQTHEFKMLINADES